MEGLVSLSLTTGSKPVGRLHFVHSGFIEALPIGW